MIYSPKCPPIYDRIRRAFPEVDWEAGLAITYGDTVYSKFLLRPEVAAHEMKHIEQQRIFDPSQWWARYLVDAEFRKRVEEEAYLAQAKFLKLSVKDRNQRFSLIHRAARDMASGMYGKLWTYDEALKLLRSV